MSRDLKYTAQKNLELEKEYLKLAFKLRCNSFFYKVKGLHQVIHIASVIFTFPCLNHVDE